MKRLIAFMLILFVILFALGCTKNTEEMPSSSTETTEETFTMFETEFRTMTAPPPQSRTPKEERIVDLVGSNAVDWILNGTDLDLFKELNLVQLTSELEPVDAIVEVRYNGNYEDNDGRILENQG